MYECIELALELKFIRINLSTFQ